eukprot:Em1069g2a
MKIKWLLRRRKPSTKRAAKLNEAENPVSSEAQPVAEAKKTDVQENGDTERREEPAEASKEAGDVKQGDETQHEAPKTTEGTDVTQKATSVETVSDTPACIAAQP